MHFDGFACILMHFKESRGAPDEQLTVGFVDSDDLDGFCRYFYGFSCILMDLDAF